SAIATLTDEARDPDQRRFGAAVILDAGEERGLIRPSSDRLGTGGVFGALATWRDANSTLPTWRRQEGDRKRERSAHALNEASAPAEREGACRAFSGPCADIFDEGHAGVRAGDDLGEQRTVDRGAAGWTVPQNWHVDDFDQRVISRISEARRCEHSARVSPLFGRSRITRPRASSKRAGVRPSRLRQRRGRSTAALG